MERSKKLSSEEEGGKGEEATLLFGWSSWTPKCLQVFNTAGWYVFLMTAANVFQSMAANGLVGVVLTSLETRFGFTSGQSSWIPGVYDVAAVPVILLISYIGSRCHRPFWTFIGEICMFLGCLLFALPHFLTDSYNPLGSDVDDRLCLNSTATEEIDRCVDDGGDGNLQKYLVIFIIARIFHGAGAEPLYMMGVTYLDDIVTKEMFSFYIAIFYLGGLVGPAIAYIAGGYLLVLFTDFYSVDAEDEFGIDASDPRWVGAWWLGFIVGAGFLLFIAIPFSFFPRDIPGAAEIRAKKKSEAYNAEEETQQVHSSDVGVTLKTLPGYLKVLFTNLTWVCLAGFSICDVILIAGFTAYGPKYVEVMFSVSPAFAGMVFGIISIPGGAGGLLFGGYIIKRFSMNIYSIMKWETIFNVLILTTIFMFFVKCDTLSFAGLNEHYFNNTLESPGNFSAVCNMNCGCRDVPFSPVCGVDNVQYFSPCHAGCVDFTGSSSKDYYNCSCLPWVEPGEVAVTSETCENPQCALLVLFLVVFCIAMFLLFVCSAMSISVIIRCVPNTHRTIGIGLQGVLARLVGGLGGPRFFAMAFDNSCDLWDDNCGERGSCLSYDLSQLAINAFLLCTIVKVAALGFMTMAWKLYKPPKEIPNEKEEIVVNNKQKKEEGVSNEAFSDVNSDSRYSPSLDNLAVSYQNGNDYTTKF